MLQDNPCKSRGNSERRDNYLLAATICCLFGLPGGFMWLYTHGKIDVDILFINNLLKGRAVEIREKNDVN